MEAGDCSQWHHLISCEELENDYENFIVCWVCKRPLWGGPAYKCLECNFRQHKSCKEDIEVEHYLRQRHHLIFIEEVDNGGKEEVVCSGCQEAILFGPAYKCSLPECTFLQKTEEETIAYAQVFQKNQAGKTEPNRVQAWRAPNHGWHKANWDVAIDKAKGRVGIGVVIRDENGQVVAALCRTRMGILEPAIGEAYAAFQAVCLCRDLGVQCVILEGDAKQIVEAIRNETCVWSRFGHLIEDTRRILLSLSSWNCVFIPRETNEAAHRMAKAATIDINDRIWRDTTPNCISDIILREQLALSR